MFYVEEDLRFLLLVLMHHLRPNSSHLFGNFCLAFILVAATFFFSVHAGTIALAARECCVCWQLTER